MSQTLRSIKKLTSRQRRLLFQFFDEIEDREKEVEERIRDIVAYKLIEDGNEKMRALMFQQAEKAFKAFESYCEQAVVRLEYEGVPTELTLPIIQYASKQLRAEALKRIRVQLKGGKK